MRRLEEAQAAELDVGHVAPGELQLQGGAVARRPEQHRLITQPQSLLAVGQHRSRYRRSLGEVVADQDETWPARGAPLRAELLAEALAREADHRVGGGQDRLGRAVVAGQRDP